MRKGGSFYSEREKLASLKAARDHIDQVIAMIERSGPLSSRRSRKGPSWAGYIGIYADCARQFH